MKVLKHSKFPARTNTPDSARSLRPSLAVEFVFFHKHVSGAPQGLRKEGDELNGPSFRQGHMAWGPKQKVLHALTWTTQVPEKFRQFGFGEL